MTDIAALVADNLTLWTGAIERRSGAGRGGGRRVSLHGIERLRGLILELAVRGRLVPQDPMEAPAANFLKQLGHPPGSHKSALPKGWEAAPLLALGAMTGGLTPSKAVSRYWGEGHPWVSPKDMGDDLVEGSEDQITAAALNETSLQLIPAGSVLMVARSGILRRKFPVAITTVDCTINQDLKAFIPKQGINVRYIQIMLRGFEARIIKSLVKRGTTVESLIYDSFVREAWPLPPLAEQRRIVAKVDELMALCDSLEQESAAALEAHQRLVEALLATLVDSPDAPTLATNWSRLEPHFDTLFTTEPSIDALKQTILELAVRGKLVPQNPSDEPAVALTTRWREAKCYALKNDGDHRIKSTSSPTKAPFAIPAHWAIESFENMFLFIDYRGNTPPKTESGIPLITAKNVRMGYLDREPREFISSETFEKWMTRGFPAIGDLFFTTEAPLGNICVNDIDEPFAIAQRLICFRPYGHINARFYMFAIISRSMQRVLDDNATGMTARGIKAANLKPIPLPVPPEPEQHRIVIKVDELMALCDALKAGLAEAAATQRHLADAIVEQAAA